MKKSTLLLLVLVFSLTCVFAGCIKVQAAETVCEKKRSVRVAGAETEEEEEETGTITEGETAEETEEAEEAQPETDMAEEMTAEELADAIAVQIRENFDQRVFDESLNMSEHPGLLNRADISGLFFEVYTADGDRYIPDIGLSDPAVPLPENTAIRQSEAVPEEYLELLFPDESDTERINYPVIYGLLEFTGYGNAGEYNGGLTLYYHRTVVSFYRYDTGEMVGWCLTSSSRSGPFVLYRSDYAYDGQRDVLTFGNGTVWADDVWTRALDELFYDENGYQVVGTRLLSVPEDVDSIIVPEGVEKIESMVGYRHTARSLILPEGVRYIGYAGFEYSGLEEISFPDSLVFAGEDAFKETPWWSDHESDDWLIVGDGVLMYGRAIGDEITLPEEAYYIMPEALEGLTCRTLIVPATVRQLCGTHIAAPIVNDELETLIIRGGLTDTLLMPEVPVKAVWYNDNLKNVVVDCEVEEIPDDWLSLNRDVFDSLTVDCGQDSCIAEWAKEKDVQCLPLEEYPASDD